jgi:hypothetical protein
VAYPLIITHWSISTSPSFQATRQEGARLKNNRISGIDPHLFYNSYFRKFVKVSGVCLSFDIELISQNGAA